MRNASCAEMANVLSNQKKQEIQALGRLGWSLRKIEEATGVRRETASNYLKAAGIAVRRERGRVFSKAASEVSTDSSKAASEVSTDLGKVERRSGPSFSSSASKCEPYREVIETAVGLGRNAMTIWQDLVDDHDFDAKYASVQRFVRTIKGTTISDAHAVIVTPPGEEGQSDYGQGPMVRCPDTGKFKRTRLFVFTLGCSRKSVWFVSFKSSSKIWAELHERAFRRLGGAPKIVVIDNLKEGVFKPDMVDPELNPLFRDMLAHYGAIGFPARVRDPDRKGKVEAGVKAGQLKFKGLSFESIEEAQEYIDRWQRNWADTRIHGTTKRQVAAMFDEEKPSLTPLPIENFTYYEYGKRKVHLDGCVEVARSYYDAPCGWVGHEVHVQWDDRRVRLLDPMTWQLLREHLRCEPGKFRIREEDRSRRTPPGVPKLLDRAERLGKSVRLVCHKILEEDGPTPGIRRVQGTLGLAKKYGQGPLAHACDFAVANGVTTYRFIKSYLEHAPQEPITLKQVHPLIRELNQYQLLLQQRIQETHEPN